MQMYKSQSAEGVVDAGRRGSRGEQPADVMAATKTLEIIVHDAGQRRGDGTLAKLPESILSDFMSVLQRWVSRLHALKRDRVDDWAREAIFAFFF